MKNEIIIPNFSEDDYMCTSKPYEFLYSFSNDKFKLAQMRERMKTDATKIGVKGFIGLWNSYLKSVNGEDGESLDNVTNFDGQPLELFSGSYICDEYGVSKTDNYCHEIQICKHPILPIQRLVNIDTGEERIKIAYKKGRQWRTIVVEKTVIAGSTSILSLSAQGIMVNCENAKYLSTYLLDIEQLNYDSIPEQRSVGRLGWAGGHGFSPYVSELIFDGDASFRHAFKSVHSEGDYDTWIDLMREIRESGAFGRLFLAASFASALVEPCGLLPFFLHAWGGTETGKTVGLMIAASVWANPKVGEYICTFNSTQVAQELYAGFLNSLPMCMDELQIQSSLGVRDFDRVIYQLTEGVGKNRGAKAGGLQKFQTWRNCIITNGEQPISNSSSGGGAVNRIIEFECTEKIYSDLVGVCDIITKDYGFAGREFVEYLQEDGVIDQVKQMQKDYYQRLLSCDSTDKQAASASAILTADEIATELIFKDGRNLTVSDLQEIMTKREDVDVNVRALEYVYDIVASNPNKFRTNGFEDYQGEVWGAVKDGYIYFIKSIFDREFKNGGFTSPASFLSWAKRCGKIECDPRQTTKKKQILGQRPRCVCLKCEGDDSLLEADDVDEIVDII